MFVGGLALLVLCCAACEYELLDGSADHLGARHRIAADLLSVPQLQCSPSEASWSWRLDGTGFHRQLVLTVANCSTCRGRRIVALVGLPRSVFADPFESKAWVPVAGEVPVDLEARADVDAAQTQLVAFQGSYEEAISIPLHFRYPALAVDDALQATVVLDCVPSIWVEGLCELSRHDTFVPLTAQIPCGRMRDVWWVVSVTVLTVVLGCAILIVRMLPSKSKQS